MKREYLRKVMYREPRSDNFAKFVKLLGIILLKSEKLGYFHETGFSGDQKNRKHDIAIIEREDGQVITLPINSKYYKFII